MLWLPARDAGDAAAAANAGLTRIHQPAGTRWSRNRYRVVWLPDQNDPENC